MLASGCFDQEKVARKFQSNRQQRYELLKQTEKGKAAQADQVDEVISGPLSVDDAVELALRYNKDVQATKLRLIEAKGQVVEAVATALPTANFTGSALRNDNTGLIAQKETYELGVLLRQPLYLGGVVGAAIDAARAFSYQTRQELRQAIQAVQLGVRQRYYSALLAAELVKVSQEARRDAQKLLEDTQAKLRYGTAARFDVLRAQVRLSAVEAELIQRQNEYQLALTQLLNELGVSQTSKIELNNPLSFEPIQVSPEESLRAAMMERPDLLIGESLIQLARDNVIGAEAGNRPKIYLQGQYQRSYPGFSANFSSLASPKGDEETPDPGGVSSGAFGGKTWERTMNGGIVVEWPFFDGMLTTGRVIKAKALLQQQQVALRKTEQKAQLEVSQALLSLESNEKFVRSQSGNVSNAQEALRLAEVAFKEGTATSLDVISAELALSQAHSDYYQAVYNYQVTILNLSAAVGTIGEKPIPQVEQQGEKTTPPSEGDNQEEKQLKEDKQVPKGS